MRYKPKIIKQDNILAIQPIKQQDNREYTIGYKIDKYGFDDLDRQAMKEGIATRKAYTSKTIDFGKRIKKHSNQKHRVPQWANNESIIL